MLSPKMLKSKISIFGGGGVGGVAHILTFDAESKNAEIQNFHGGGSLTY